MGVDKAAFVKEFVNGVSDHRPDAEHGVKGVGPGAQIGNRAEKLQRMALFLKGVVGGGSAFQNNFACVDFIGLLCFGSQDYGAFDDNGGAHVEFCDFLKIIYLALFENHL